MWKFDYKNATFTHFITSEVQKKQLLVVGKVHTELDSIQIKNK